MNINQVLTIFDWDTKKIYKQNKIPELFTVRYGDYLTHLTIVDISETDIIFNHVTSEVIFIDVSGKHSASYIVDANENIYNEVCQRKPVNESEMLNILNDINKKEHDEIVNFNIDNDALAFVDDAADKSNISRQQFIAKVLINKILENENV